MKAARFSIWSVKVKPFDRSSKKKCRVLARLKKKGEGDIVCEWCMSEVKQR